MRLVEFLISQASKWFGSLEVRRSTEPKALLPGFFCLYSYLCCQCGALGLHVVLFGTALLWDWLAKFRQRVES